MKPRAAPRTSATSRARPRDETPNPFRFGWRYVRTPGANGSSEPECVPLTPDDVLHPREHDQIPENTYQERTRRYVASVLEHQLAGQPHVAVLSDCLVNWGIEGLGNHSPDISVFDGVANPKQNWGTFYVVKERARPLLALEIVSVDHWTRKPRNNDVVIKVREYYRAGVPLYVIVDQEEEEGPRRLLGYRRGPRKYEALPLDEQGRLRLEPVKLWLGLRDDRVVCFDAATGEEIGDLTDQVQARQAAEADRAAEAEARQAAEADRAAEAEARQAAEADRAAEAEARRTAEAQAAEQLARAQAAEAALAAAQTRLQELEAKTRRGGTKGRRR